MTLDFDAAIRTLGIRLERSRHGQWIGMDDPGGHTVRQSITAPEGVYLAEWASGQRVLEIGTGLGVSTVCLASTALSVVTIDPDPWVLRSLTLPANVTQRASLDGVTGPFDFAFIDGLHDCDSVCRDIEDCLARLTPKGRLAFHDTHHEGVGVALTRYRWRSRERMRTLGNLTLCERPE